MSFTENAVARWAELQRLQASPGWKFINANPWVLALFREAFTRTRPRIPLDEFHSITDSFLQQLRLNGQSLREDWTGKNYADDWVARRFLARPRADGRFVYELTEPAVRFLSYLDGFTGDTTSLNSSRLNTLLSSVETLAHESNPDPEARSRTTPSISPRPRRSSSSTMKIWRLIKERFRACVMSLAGTSERATVLSGEAMIQLWQETCPAQGTVDLVGMVEVPDPG
ncbi:DUF3375 family protein [Arthrobacter koreensis]|uniref:DUF3375 family protein n=1 Tax=Arthrobacter koreensis TaxID=199136 RepID=UPI002DBD279D|nr:DUF3375 family protein [Arthrobacter koreensis]MEB7504943.1 DUF3375 domain-containing protein [Arthrobacter koreensis]